MKKGLHLAGALTLLLCLVFPLSAFAGVQASLPGSDFKAGDTITIEGNIEPGQDLFVTISSEKMFAPKDTKGVHETKRFKKEAKKRGFTADTSIPTLYYILTNTPEKFGKVKEKRFGGPAFFTDSAKR